MEKRERAWYLFSCEWRQDRKDGRKGLIVRGCTGPRTAKRANVAGNLTHVSSKRSVIVVYTERWACSQFKNTPNVACLFWKFSPFFDYVMLTWEKIAGSSRFSILQVTESWAGPGNEARYLHYLSQLLQFTFRIRPIVTCIFTKEPLLHCTHQITVHPKRHVEGLICNCIEVNPVHDIISCKGYQLQFWNTSRICMLVSLIPRLLMDYLLVLYHATKAREEYENQGTVLEGL